MKTIKYMGKDFRILSEYGKENHIPFKEVFERTSNVNKGAGVTLTRGLPQLYKFRDNLTLRTVLRHQGCNTLLKVLKNKYPILLDVLLDKLVPCKFIAEKRTKFDIMQQLRDDNMMLEMDTEDIIHARVVKYIDDKYSNITNWYLYFKKVREEKYKNLGKEI